MGHLISIANNIVKQAEKCENFDKFLKTNVDKVTYEKWESLVNTQLAEINKTNEILLVRKKKNLNKITLKHFFKLIN